MKALFTLGMVLDLEPDEIPEVAAKLNRNGMDSMYAGLLEALAGRELSEDEVVLIREKFQIYGVSYSVLQELEIPAE